MLPASILALFLLLLATTSSAVPWFQAGVCSSTACLGGGECHKGTSEAVKDSFWCRCPTNRKGPRCEEECRLKCATGQTCVFDVAGRPFCCAGDDCEKIFQAGFTSKDSTGCSGNATEAACSDSSDCQKCFNGGVCRGKGPDAKCVCPEGLAGEFCEEDIDECSDGTLRCYNGKCINQHGSYECECKPGYVGETCMAVDESEEDYKHELDEMKEERQLLCRLEFSGQGDVTGKMQPCNNGGFCNRTNNVSSCVCPRGFEGTFCEHDVDECLLKPCQNGATCRNIPGSFQCICQYGHEGSFCEIDTDDCIDNKCAPGSKCVDKQGWYVCECGPDKTGETCELTNPCFENPCVHGSCSLIEDSEYECHCESGFQGELCEAKIDECAVQNRCYNGGDCVSTVDGWHCKCRRGFNGTACEQYQDPCESEHVDCANGGTCMTDADEEPVCVCEQGFIGRRCEFACPPGMGGVECDVQLGDPQCSDRTPCRNSGICRNGVCKCPVQFTGNRCEYRRSDGVRDACRRDPCLNNATCIDIADNRIGYVCQCQEPFEGDVCERRKDVCDVRPCFNGGECVKNPGFDVGFACRCSAGFRGSRCELVEDVSCASRLCLNGGQCKNASNGLSECSCPFGFIGNRCEHRVQVDQFSATDRAYKEMCERRNCSLRAADGVCDDDCNFAVCEFDGGDCSARQRPFSRCRYAAFCSHVFQDGKCDQACNNEECLYDGMDCLPIVPRCPALVRDHCAAHYADGFCNLECNTNACGFDGGDCEKDFETNVTIKVLPNLRIKFLLKIDEFQRRAPDFLMRASAALRVPVRIQRDEHGPLIFEWSESKLGRRLFLKDFEAATDDHHRVARRAIRRRGQEGVIAWFEVDVSSQSSPSERSCSSCLFTDSQSVVDFVAADVAKKGADAFGVPIYEAVVAKPSRASSSWGSTQFVLLLVIGVFIALSLAVGVAAASNSDGARHSRKRRVVTAPVWMPPTDSELKKQALTSSQSSLLGSAISGCSYFDPKRPRMDSFGLSSFYQNGCYANAPQANSFDFGYASSSPNQSPPQPIDKPPKLMVPPTKLHLQAEGNSKITVQLTHENVNVADDSFKRTALHWVAANSKGKPEDVVLDDAVRLLDAGANVNAQDIDEDTPLLLAVRARRCRLVAVLLRFGADPRIFNKYDRSALHEAAVNLDFMMTRILLRDKRMVEDVDEIDNKGQTALMVVARLDTGTEIARHLLQCGAKIECDGNSRKESDVYTGRTALHYAAQVSNLGMVEYLVKCNANKDKQDETGQTPLMLAAKEGHLKTVQFLVDKGASIEITDQMDKTARHLAAGQFHQDVVDFLDAVDDKQRSEDSALRHQMLMSKVKCKSYPTGGGVGRPSIKAVKRSAGRKPPPGILQDPHTPPPSDGSMSSPSPPHFASEANSGLNFSTTSSSCGSSQHSSHAESPDYHPPDCAEQPPIHGQTQRWYEASPPYDNHVQTPGIPPHTQAVYRPNLVYEQRQQHHNLLQSDLSATYY